MALTPCRECKTPISSDAKTCPQCGAKQDSGPGFFALLGIILVGALTLSSIFKPSTPENPPLSAEEKARAERREREFQTMLAGAKWLKNGMKKPETFQLLEAFMVDGKAACFHYKARNSFNDVRPAWHVITDTVNSDSTAAYNKHCAGKTGEDYSSISAVLD